MLTDNRFQFPVFFQMSEVSHQQLSWPEKREFSNKNNARSHMQGKYGKGNSQFQTGLLTQQKNKGRKKQNKITDNGLPAEITMDGPYTGFIQHDVNKQSCKKTQPCILKQFVFYCLTRIQSNY